MKFSQVSGDSRLNKQELLRNNNGNQEDLKKRLKDLAHGLPAKPQQRRTQHKAINPNQESTAYSKLLELKECGESGSVPKMESHPLWYPGADKKMFAETHVDKRGRSWSHADAAFIMQPVIKGFLYRKLKKKESEAALEVLQKLYSKKIQTWWRGILARETMRRLSFQKSFSATCIIQGCCRRCCLQIKYHMCVKERSEAALKIQMGFRKNRMLRIIPILKHQRLTRACILVQRHFREHKRWTDLVAEEQQKVYKLAKEQRDDYLFAARSKEETEAIRKNAAANFIASTDVFARKVAFSKQKAEQAKLQAIDVSSETGYGQLDQKNAVSLKRVQEVSKHDFWNLDAKPKDSHDVSLKLDECRKLRLITLDLTRQTGGLRETLTRWPYGMQGKHDLFHIATLCISGNEVSGLPLDFYYLTSLTEIRANNNRIKTLLPQIKNLQEMQNFWFHSNMLTNIPMEIGTLSKLVQLSLSDNQITVLPGEVGYLPALRGLRLENNPWQSPPKEIIKTLRPSDGKVEIERVMEYLRKYHGAVKDGAVELDGQGLLRIPDCFSHLKTLRKLMMQNNRIRIFEDALLDLVHLLVLRLDENRLERVPKGIKKLKLLRELGLSKNRIEQGGLSFDSIIVLTNLQDLALTDNFLHSPPVEILVQSASNILEYMRRVRGAHKVGTLDLKSFRLRTFPVIDAHVALRKIVFDDNLFREFPDSVLVMEKLKELHLSSNLLSSFPVGLTILSRLTILNLSSNSISNFPEQIMAFGQLVDLDLSHNMLPEIPPCISHLTNLRFLAASYNKVRLIAQKLCVLPLWELNLSYNCLHGLPDSFKDMRELRKFNVEGNRLPALPNSIVKCSLVQLVNASKNPLASMPASFSGFANVQLLMLSDCKLSELPISMAGAVHLQTVELERNQFETFPTGICTLKKIESLKMKENFIVEIPPDVGTLTSLTYLDLSRNRICLIAPEIRHLSNMINLDLSYNKIRALPPFLPHVAPALGLLERLQILNVGHNLLCSLPQDLCSLDSLQQLVLEGNPWTGSLMLKRILESSSNDSCGDLIVHVLEAEALARMDGGGRLSDPYVVVELGAQNQKSQVKPGTLNPKWDQVLTFNLWGNADESLLAFKILDWDANGAHEIMGKFEVKIDSSVLQRCKVGPPDAREHREWYALQGSDALGRKAKGKVLISLKFYQNDGSLRSVMRYLNMVKHSGWTPLPGAAAGEGRAASVQRKAHHPTPDGEAISEYEQDDARERAELQRADVATKQVREWLWRAGDKREPWQDLDIFFAPSGVANRPWEIGKERYDQQFDAMSEFLAARPGEPPQPHRIIGGAAKKPRASGGGGASRGSGGAAALGARAPSADSALRESWSRSAARETERELLSLLKDELDMEY